jgi:hypothetical protein
MATMPKVQILAAFSNTQVASQCGRRVRKLVSDNRFVLGISLASEAIAGDCWELDRGRNYHAVGASAGTAWGPVGFAIIDDPIGTREDAGSPLAGSARVACRVAAAIYHRPRILLTIRQRSLVLEQWQASDVVAADVDKS